MPLQIVRNDITKMKVDAIVNAANSSLLGGGGVDGCIHRAAGPELLAECEMLNGCKTGSAKITKGYKLPCKYVIHAVGPRWCGGQYGEHDKLVSCYQTSLALAKEHGCESVAFPLISSGIFGYPKDEALKVAIDTISSFLLENDMMVYIVIFDRKAYQISSKLFADINAYIDDRYVEEHRDSYAERISRLHSLVVEESCPIPAAPMVTKAASLDDALKQIDESFSEMLLRKIDECGMTDAECYKKANIDRKLFSKIRSDKLYRPSKPTVIAFAIALELPLDELKDKHTVEDEITEEVLKHTDTLNLLCSIPGIDVTAAAAIIAEIGTDMSSFPDSQHICSWAGLSPGNNESAGKRKSVHINKGNPYLKSMLCEVAWIMASHRKLYLSGWYWKVKQRKGAKRATIALARKILSIIYTMLKTGTPYNEECFEQRRLRCERKRANRLVNELQKLGYVVVAPD